MEFKISDVKELDSLSLERETYKKFDELNNLQLILRRLKGKLREKAKTKAYEKHKRFYGNILKIVKNKIANDSIGEKIPEGDLTYKLDLGDNDIVLTIYNEELRLSELGGPAAPGSGKDTGVKPEVEASADRHPEEDVVHLANGDAAVKLDGDLYIPLEYHRKLYAHQKRGLKWLARLHNNNLGGILADDMGLGKTVTVLSLLNALVYSTGLGPPGPELDPDPDGEAVTRVLIVCNVTLIEQWRSEINNWVSDGVRLYILHNNYDINRDYHGNGQAGGDGGAAPGRGAGQFCVYLVGYEYLRINVDYINRYDWAYLILDEGQKIKNPNALVTLAVKSIPTPHRLVLSGSPIQNNLTELWSLIDFVVPGLLGSLASFVDEYAAPISAGEAGSGRLSKLKRLVLPYVFRTLKPTTGTGTGQPEGDGPGHSEEPEEPAAGPPGRSPGGDPVLPSKVERIILCNLSAEQYRLYVRVLNRCKKTLKGLPSGHHSGPTLSRDVRRLLGKELTKDKTILQVIDSLRKICNHPKLLAPGQAQDAGPATSSKLDVSLRVIRVWRGQKAKILLFTQTVAMQTIVRDALLEVYPAHELLTLNGKMPVAARNDIIARFSTDPEIFILLLTTKVGGVGLNLTAATRVLIFDPDWNPATDLQARERSYRIGQTRHVHVYRLITAHTIEERIYQRQLFKWCLSQRVLSHRELAFFSKYVNNIQYLLSYPPPPGANAINRLVRHNDFELVPGGQGTQGGTISPPSPPFRATRASMPSGSAAYRADLLRFFGPRRTATTKEVSLAPQHQLITHFNPLVPGRQDVTPSPLQQRLQARPKAPLRVR